MTTSQAFTIRINDDCYDPNAPVIATHLQRAIAIAQARAIASSGYWMRVPVGFATVYEGRREVAAFHYGAK
jgi:hypothetical protein